MKSNRIIIALVIILVLSVIGGGLSVFLSKFINFSTTKAIETTVPKTKQIGFSISFNPPKIQDAPENIKEAVILGYNIMTDTRKYTAGYVGNRLNCDDCHFNGGITEGGKNGGLSLVGVAAAYPKFRKRQNYAVDLVARTNDCFIRSMNGKPLPPDSKEMTAIVTYYQWISKGLPIYEDIPWLGIKLIKIAHTPETGNGKQVFMRQCAVCHGNDGQGKPEVPALWGSGSFNDGAGMNKPETFAAFAFLNMPRANPFLTAEQALDVSAFVSAQPRPHFASQKK